MLEKDLGLKGENANQFMVEFSRRFKVDIETFNLHFRKYFTPDKKASRRFFEALITYPIRLVNYFTFLVIDFERAKKSLDYNPFDDFFSDKIGDITINNLIDSAKNGNFIYQKNKNVS